METEDTQAAAAGLNPLRSLDHPDDACALQAACTRALIERRLLGGARSRVVIADRSFEVIRLVGKGGMGILYEVETARGERVALKLLRESSPETVFALKREFRALAGVEHDGLVAYEDLLVDGASAAITMELIDGVDFVAYARAHGSDSLLDATVRLAEALATLHAAGIVHRDIKPNNVLVTATGRVALLDFGIASAHGVPDDGWGTTAFIAPERFAGAPAAPAADAFAVGILLHRALQQLEPTQRDPRLATLACALVAPDPLARPDARTMLAMLGREPRGIATSIAWVGREDAAAELLSVVRDEGARVAVVVAPSGFGKTGLLDRVERAARDSGASIFRGRCERRELVPNRALDAVVDALSEHWLALDDAAAASLVPPDIDALVRVFPVLARIPAVESRAVAAPTSDPLHTRRRAILALREVLSRIARQRRVAIVIDDAQWADDEGLALLTEALRPPSAPPIALVIARRPLSERRPHPLLRGLEEGATRIELGALDEHDALTLLRAMLPEASSERLDALAAQSRGEPLLLREIAMLEADRPNPPAGIAEPLALGPREHESSADDSRAYDPSASIEQILVRRVATLSEDERAVAELLAISTRALDVDAAAAVMNLPPPQVARVFRALRLARLARTGADGGGSIELVHDRVADALGGSLDDTRRRALHTRLAARLQATSQLDPDVLVHHWASASEPRRAAESAVLAARDALSRLAFHHAARFFQLALELDPARDDAHALRLALADALASAGLAADAASTYDRLADDAVEPEEVVRFRRRAAEELVFVGRRVEGLARLESVLASARLRRTKTRAGVVFSLLFHRVRLWMRGFGFEPRAAEAVPRLLLRQVDVALAMMRALGGHDVLEGIEWVSRAFLLALRAGEPSRLARVFAAESVNRAVMGQSSLADTLAASAIELGARGGDPSALAFVHATLAMGALATGEPLRAREHARKSLDLYGRCAVTSGAEAYTAHYFYLLARETVGERGLRRELEEALRSAEERGQFGVDVAYRLGLAQHWTLTGELERARAEVEIGITRWSSEDTDTSWWAAVARLAQLDLACGKPHEARARVLGEWSRIERSGLLHVPLYRGLSWHLRAIVHLAAADGAGEDPRPALLEARRCAARLGRDSNRFVRALGAQIAAIVAAHESEGSPAGDAARAELGAVAATLDEMGWTWLAAASRYRAAELAGDRGNLAALRDSLREQGMVAPESFFAFQAPPLGPAARGVQR